MLHPFLHLNCLELRHSGWNSGKRLGSEDEGTHGKNGRGESWLGHGFLIILKLPCQP